MSDLDRNKKNKVIVGNVVINPCVLREFLKKSHYFMSYKPGTETIKLSVNHNLGGQDLLRIRNASYENAVKLAEKLGLGADGDRPPLFWAKWNPVYELYHDGSEDAETLKMEMLKLGLPFSQHGAYNYYSNSGVGKKWAWVSGGHIFTPPMWKVSAVLIEIRNDAKRYEKQLTSTP